MSVLSNIQRDKIIAIVRGAKPEDVLRIATAVYEGGVKIIEVTMNSHNALSVIAQLSNAMGNHVLIGAGTVLNSSMAKEAIGAGAKFIISPSLDLKTIKITKQLGAVSIPGAYTPTEILSAHSNGADIVKVFPAGTSAHYFRDLQGPFSHIPMMPTGGISLGNIREFYEAGGVAFGIGTALVNTNLEVNQDYLKTLTAKAKQFVDLISPSNSN
ncbi:MAG: bifunctional 4-hydroxy-2-oxoglutarate aldolase/2-dehydro-3-deoxy-phosphogluconate aldolase [Ferruginibacter sp.]